MKEKIVKLIARSMLFAIAAFLIICVAFTFFPRKENTEYSNQIIKGSSETRSLVVYFTKCDVTENGREADASSKASIDIYNSEKVGKTEKAALMIQKQTGADLYPIVTKEYYSKGFYITAGQALRELESDKLPELVNLPESLDDYDIIYVGYPVWWYELPVPVASFLSNYDLSGKTIVPFCTSMGSGVQDGYEMLEEYCPESEIKNGLTYYGQGDEKIQKWLEEENLK